MQPIVSLVVHQPSRLPEEPSVFSLLLVNPSDDDGLVVPLPGERWWQVARMQVTRPDGTLAGFRLADAATPAPECSLELFEGAELEHEFSLAGRVADIDQPGIYTLQGVLESPAGLWPIPPVQWLVEAPRPLLVSVSAPRVPSETTPIRLWTLARGARRSALLARELLFDDTEGEKPAVSSPWTVRDVETTTSSLVSGSASPDAPAPWVAWLANETVHVGHGAATTSCVVPGASELLGLAVRPDGGAELFVRTAATDQVVWLTVAVPVPVDPPPVASDEDDFPPPSAYVHITPPAVRLVFATPASARFGAACGAGAGRTVVARLTEVGAAIEVAVARLVAGEAPRWTSARIAGARLVAGAGPAVVVDDDDVTRVAVLFHRPTAEVELGAAVLAFDAEGYPLWRDGAEGRPVASPAGVPTTGALALWTDPGTGAWSTSWCAVFADRSCLLCHGLRAPSHRRPGDAVVIPVGLLVSPGACAVVCQSPGGAVGLVWT